MKASKSEDKFSEKEATARFEAALKSALKTPHKPLKPAKTPIKKSKAAKKPSK
jgi:hypothetical protein